MIVITAVSAADTVVVDTPTNTPVVRNVNSLSDTASSPQKIADTSAAQSVNTYTDTLTSPPDTLTKSGPDIADTVFYESDFVDYDNEARTLQLFGRAQVKYQNIILQADTIVYDVDNNQFQARGRPQLVEGNDTTVGDVMVYNIKTRRGRVSYSTVRFDDTYFTGGNIVKTEENCLYIESGDYTTCENPDHPHYYFYSDQIKVIPEDMAVGKPMVLNIGDAPIAILPFFLMPLERGRRGGWLTPVWGGNLNRGGYVDNLGYYFAPSDYYDVLLSVKAQEFQSFVFNTRGRYALRYTLDGEVSGRYVLDNDIEMEARQWALDYRHNHLLTPDGRTRMSGHGSLLSNRTFNKNYSDVTYELEQQQLDANMALSHKFETINASSNLVWRRNHNLTTDRIQEDIPSADFNLHNRAFVPYDAASGGDPSWYNNIYFSYNTKANVRRDVYANDSLPGFTAPGMEHNVNLNSSQKIMRYFDISPYFNMRASMFYGAIDTLIKKDTLVRDTLVYRTQDPVRDNRALDYDLVSEKWEYFVNAQGDYDSLCTVTKVSPLRRHIERDTLHDEINVVRSWNAGVNLSTRVYGLFPMGGFLGVSAVRHTMTPTIGYSYTPKHELDRMFYDVRINYDRPREKAAQLMNFSLSNTFQGKRTVKTDNAVTVNNSGDEVDSAGIDADQPKTQNVKPREEKFDILSVSMSTSYDFEADSLKWRNLALNASTSLFFLRMSHSSNYWLYDETNALSAPIIKDYNFGLTSGSLGASGSFWDGDLLTLESDAHGHPHIAKTASDPQKWDISFSPGFNYRASRAAQSDPFTPTKSFNLSAGAGMNITREMSVRWNGNYDFTSNQFSHNNYTFHYDLECWEMRFVWRPEKINPGFHFVVNVKKLPDLKWENRESRTTTLRSY